MLVADRGRRPHQNPYPAPRSPPRLPVHREHRRQLRAREIARIAGARSARQCRPCPPGPERGAARLERKRKPARGVQRRRPGTHGAIILDQLQQTKLTKWEFVSQFSSEVLRAVSTRRRQTAIVRADGTTIGGAGMPATRAEAHAHEPRWFSAESRKRKRAEGGVSRAANCRGATCCLSPDCAEGEPKRPSFFCAGCKRERDKCNGWYHWSCYWKRHRAVSIE